jgi:hypothetical protein
VVRPPCYKAFAMRRCAAWLALATLLLVTFPAPLAAVGETCGRGAVVEAGCCDLDCALCACCSHLPTSDLASPAVHRAALPVEGLAPPAGAAPRAAWPLGILHVPKPVSA